ncbi:hypothetical protein D3C81_564840 [compost metagenome]
MVGQVGLPGRPGGVEAKPGRVARHESGSVLVQTLDVAQHGTLPLICHTFVVVLLERWHPDRGGGSGGMAEMALGVAEQQAVGRGLKGGWSGSVGHETILPCQGVSR